MSWGDTSSSFSSLDSFFFPLWATSYKENLGPGTFNTVPKRLLTDQFSSLVRLSCSYFRVPIWLSLVSWYQWKWLWLFVVCAQVTDTELFPIFFFFLNEEERKGWKERKQRDKTMSKVFINRENREKVHINNVVDEKYVK